MLQVHSSNFSTKTLLMSPYPVVFLMDMSTFHSWNCPLSIPGKLEFENGQPTVFQKTAAWSGSILFVKTNHFRFRQGKSLLNSFINVIIIVINEYHSFEYRFQF